MTLENHLGEPLAAHLLAIGAVTLRPDEPFTWASGLKAPIYTDNRLTLAHPELRAYIAARFVQTIEEMGYIPDVIAGTATAGIPHAAFVADRMNAAMAYVRGAAKEHGRKNRIEGQIEPGDQVLVIEDLVSTGGSVLDAAEAVHEAGADPIAVLAVFTYGFAEAEERFAAAGLPLHALTDLDALLEVAEEKGALTRAQLDTIRDWRDDPKAWSDRFAA